LGSLKPLLTRIFQIMPSLPPNTRFYINRLTFSVFPMIGFSVTSLQRPLTELWDLVYYDFVPRLYRLPGVSEARIVGGRPPEYHILVDPERLNGYNLPLTQVVDAIRNSNTIVPAGMVQENYHLYLVKFAQKYQMRNRNWPKRAAVESMVSEAVGEPMSRPLLNMNHRDQSAPSAEVSPFSLLLIDTVRIHPDDSIR
jgi:multidrug efflux pump subunit AcrB